MTDRPLLIIDGASQWFRSFYGVPDSVTSPDGRPVNAVRGFLDTLATLITRENPSRVAVCLDLDWRPAFRVSAIASYKAHRVVEVAPGGIDTEEVPDTLTPQVPMILDVLAAAGIATAGATGYEADDVLGTLAARETADPVLVVSGDRDLLQVVSDDPVPVRVLYTGRGLAKAVTYGPVEVAETYGVPAHRPGPGYAELALLRGDPSDGLPGVAGIGEKTASKLILEFGDLATLRAAIDDPASSLAKGVRAKLAAAQDYYEPALRVVRVATDVPIEFSGPDALPAEPVDRERLTQLGEELGISSSLERLAKACGWS